MRAEKKSEIFTFWKKHAPQGLASSEKSSLPLFLFMPNYRGKAGDGSRNGQWRSNSSIGSSSQRATPYLQWRVFFRLRNGVFSKHQPDQWIYISEVYSSTPRLGCPWFLDHSSRVFKRKDSRSAFPMPSPHAVQRNCCTWRHTPKSCDGSLLEGD